MTTHDIITELRAWSEIHRSLNAQMDKLAEMFGPNQTPLNTAIDRLSDAHTEEVGKRIGDVAGLMNLWRYEALFGESPISALIDGRHFSLDSIESLADAIVEARNAETTF